MTDVQTALRRPTLTEEQQRWWVIDRQGKLYVTYPALLEIAHNQFGLKRTATKLVQIPTAENQNTAIVTCEVEVAHGTFTGIGEAAPSNVSRMMVNALIRFAETRAKARALRDAINASAWALDGDVEEAPGGETQQPTMEQARGEFEGMLSRESSAPVPIKEVIKSYGLALGSDGSSVKLIDGKPVSSLRPEPAPRGPGTVTQGSKRLDSDLKRVVTPVDRDLVPTLAVARKKWDATVKLANGLGVRIPIMTDAQMADPMELQIEGRKLSRAVNMKQQELGYGPLATRE